MRIFRLLAALMVSLGLLSGCGEETTASSDGSLVIGITDAEGDFLAYAVDVASIKLTHADGRVVETLPQSARIDFAQYVDLTEFVTAATIPNGRYTKASLVLDYSSADIQVEVAGLPVQAQLRDGQGNAITTREVAVTFDGDHPVVIAPGVVQHLTLDFDLQTSHTVDTSVNPPVVTADPLLVADVAMDSPKPHRMRGLLQSVDQVQNTIELQMRPFQRQVGNFGSFEAHVNGATSYEIDGVVYSGSAGLAQLALQPLTSWVVVLGDINTTTRQFVATELYAGSSVPGSSQDAVVGVVTARSGDQLTVKARMIVRTDGSLIFNRDVTVALDTANTKVTRQLSNVAVTTGDISVGQRLELLGTIVDNAGALSLNSTSNARMLLSFLSGNAVSMSGELVVNLQHVEGLVPATYDFAGTGTSGAMDADPANYQVDVGSLSLNGILTGDPVRVNGFVAPFGLAPADFKANTVIRLADVRAMMVLQWALAEATPFASSSASGLVVDLAGSQMHHLQRGLVRTNLVGLGQAPVVQPEPSGKGVFAINAGGSVQLYTSFSAFELALSERLAAGGKLARMTASGRFDDAAVRLTVRAINVVVKQ